MGGCDEQIKRLIEVVELPLLDPDRWVGGPMHKGCCKECSRGEQECSALLRLPNAAPPPKMCSAAQVQPRIPVTLSLQAEV